MQLPYDLRAGLVEEVEKVPSRDIATAVRQLSHRYRTEHGRSGTPFLNSAVDVTAYLAYRLPATFAAVVAVLEEVRARRPDLQPRSLLDVGGGPGTAAWAAVEVWPELERITTLERDAEMIRIGQALASHSGSPAVRSEVWRRVDVSGPWDCIPADIVVAAYMIGELPAEARTGFARRLWDCSADTCVIIEPGTPRGFELVRQAGDELLNAGAHILAPFPQDWQCLENEDDWYHFSERVPRTRLHRVVKDAILAYEDEKYSYLAASRVEGSPIAARVIRHPQVRPGHIRLVLCTGEGVQHVVVTRSNREAFRRAKSLAWGSAILPEETSLYGLSTRKR